MRLGAGHRTRQKSSPGPRDSGVPDSPAALACLKQHCKLVTLPKVERASFGRSNSKLGVRFDPVYAAEDVGSHKPDSRNFTDLLEHVAADLGIEPTGPHAAQSLGQDHLSAQDAGLAGACRAAGRDAGGAVRPNVVPDVDFTLRTLAETVEAHRIEAAR